MKRILLILSATLLLFGLFQAGTPKTASGFFSDNSQPNTWVGAEEIPFDLNKYPLPEWGQISGNPGFVSTPGKVCHNFREGQFFWTGEMRLWQDGHWVLVESTAGWVPNKEGKFMVCFDAPVAGIYALFTFYSPPADWVPYPVEILED